LSRALENLRSHVFLKTRHLNIKVTASFGIASVREDGNTIDALIAAADKAMYIVKKGSKDGIHALTKPITLVGSKS
jgi:GGDEF domain-containing protein